MLVGARHKQTAVVGVGRSHNLDVGETLSMRSQKYNNKTKKDYKPQLWGTLSAQDYCEPSVQLLF